MFDLTSILIVAGLMFSGGMAVIGFGGFLTAWFHHTLGDPLPIPSLRTPREKRVYLSVAAAGFVMWAVVFLISLRVAP